MRSLGLNARNRTARQPGRWGRFAKSRFVRVWMPAGTVALALAAAFVHVDSRSALCAVFLQEATCDGN